MSLLFLALQDIMTYIGDYREFVQAPVRYMRIILITILVVTGMVSGSRAAVAEHDEAYAVIMAYFQVGNDLDPQTSISEDLFRQHINLLTSASYNVISLKDFSAGYNFSEDQKNIILTFENVTPQTLSVIRPILDIDKTPYTIFIAPQNFSSAAARDLLREMSELSHVSIGLHLSEYIFYEDEGEFRQNLNRAKTWLRDQTDEIVTFFAFPYSLYRQKHLDIVNEHKFQAVLGQNSGAASRKMKVLPRFTMTQNYAALERLSHITHSAPFKIVDQSPPVSVLSHDPTISITLDEVYEGRADELSCFLTGQGKLSYEILGKTHIELRPSFNDVEGRYRLNCTLPVYEDSDKQDVYWLGYLFHYTPSTTIQLDELPESPE